MMMRVFALSDIHIDYPGNQSWVANLSRLDYQNDILILAGDVSDVPSRLAWCLKSLAQCFRQVLFVPGNHDLWMFRDARDEESNPGTLALDSLEKFAAIRRLAEDCGVAMRIWQHGELTVVPLLSWYDYSFGQPGEELLVAWMDYRACRWPDGLTEKDITRHFLQQNPVTLPQRTRNVITFSHFLPRIDVMPHYIPHERRMVYPVLGSSLLDAQVRLFQPQIHVYGHSHVNRQVAIDGIMYVNNAFGYPNETRITAKELVCIATI